MTIRRAKITITICNHTTLPIGIKADDMFTGGMRGEGELSFVCVKLGKNQLIVGIMDLHVHSDARRRWHEAVGVGIKKLDLVVRKHQRIIRYLLDEALSLAFLNVKIDGLAGLEEETQAKGHQGAVN